ncbi:MAG: restriction endonuclease [Candidatus Aminicenantes bacterium]|nr:restriction endonuclease [Candidatus Aminicenantes bacterium]
MALWLVRAGKHGEYEDKCLELGISAIGWNDLPDLASIKARDELKDLFEKIYPDKKKMALINEASQVWALINRIQKDDLIILPLKRRAAIAIGRVSGSYRFREDLDPGMRHTRPVEWLKKDLPRTLFSQDLLYSFGAFMTVCQIRRNRAEERVQAILAGKKDIPEKPESIVSGQEESEEIDIETLTSDQILDFLRRKFKGHDFARLIEAILKAQGYITKRADPGPDGGVDILASAGPMGFDKPYLCVQVKSSETPADVTVLRSLQGVMKGYGADQGLLVSWGGYTIKALEEAKRSFFTIRLWDSNDVIDALFKHYENFDDELKAELPLKRIWCLVLEGD